MMSSPSYTLEQIEARLQRKSWWAMLFILPLARRLSLFFINRTNISPNAITIGSFIFIPLAAFAFCEATYASMVVGAILFEVNYLLDCVDGTVARVKKLTSPLGAYLDPMLDRLRIVVLTLSLAWGQYISAGSTTTVLLVFLYLGLNNLILFSRSAQEKALAKRGQDGRLGVDLVRSTSGGGIVSWWFDVASKRNMMPYYHDIELDALVFVVGPLMNMVVPFLVVANALAVMLVILLNIMFLQSLWRDQRMKDNA